MGAREYDQFSDLWRDLVREDPRGHYGRVQADNASSVHVASRVKDPKSAQFPTYVLAAVRQTIDHDSGIGTEKYPIKSSLISAGMTARSGRLGQVGGISSALFGASGSKCWDITDGMDWSSKESAKTERECWQWRVMGRADDRRREAQILALWLSRDKGVGPAICSSVNALEEDGLRRWEIHSGMSHLFERTEGEVVYIYATNGDMRRRGTSMGDGSGRGSDETRNCERKAEGGKK
ncbi:hypothetical protein K474DRAFT_1673996 [Panus rudis PR-1116 ss-1]|nr:hypothetical protein K474DRAFT_1673996 [Panus rudis PR-1116 ss-1]